MAKKRSLWISQISQITSVKSNWFNSENIVFTDESVKSQIIDSISENLTDSDSESRHGKAGIFKSENSSNINILSNEF